MTDDQSEVMAFLSRPEAYGLRGAAVERHTTHGSVVFLAGDRAYKLKRAVRFSYMDYATRERRKAMCEAELAANKRLAPEIYLGVVPVTRAPDGALAIGGTGEALDWLVVMRRFDEDTLLDAMRAKGTLPLDIMRPLGERIAAFHRDASRCDDSGGAAGIAAVLAENTDCLGQSAGAPFDPAKIARFDRLVRAEFDRVRDILEQRRREGFVRRCHGDLHLNNICMIGGAPVPFDAIEFRDEFVRIDVLFDLAYLLMDLDRRGLRAHANAVLNRYLEISGDYAGLAALPLFLACRAGIRAHVRVAMGRGDGGRLAPDAAAEAVSLLDCAIAVLEPRPAELVAVGGVSGTGKSTLAAALAPHLGRAPGAAVIRSDVVRKTLRHVPDTERLPAAAYSDDESRKVYDEVGRRVRSALRAGQAVIADAVFGQARERDAMATLAAELALPFHGLWLDADEACLVARLARRQGDASDATADVMRAQRSAIVPPAEWCALAADRPLAELVAKARHACEDAAGAYPPRPR